MKTISNVFTSLIVTAWIAAIAILSVQNATLVSLRFLTFESIRLPVGIVLAFSVGIGIMGGGLVPVLWKLTGSRQQAFYEDEDY